MMVDEVVQDKITRNHLLQASSTVLAGALIFLTLGSTLKLEIRLIFVASIYLLIIAIGILIAPQAYFGKKPLSYEKSLTNGGRLFVLALIMLFSAIAFSIILQ